MERFALDLLIQSLRNLLTILPRHQKKKINIHNNIHEKTTQFWLAEKEVQLFCNTSAKCVTRVQTCNTSANYKCFLIG